MSGMESITTTGQDSSSVVDMTDQVMPTIYLGDSAGHVETSVFTRYGVETQAIDEVLALAQTDERAQSGLHRLGSFDPATRDHVIGVSLIATHLGLHEGLPEDKRKVLALGAMLHDVGKVAVSHDIINPARTDTSKLDRGGTDLRWKAVQRHPEAGYRITRDMYTEATMFPTTDKQTRRLVPQLVLTHHCHNAARDPYPSPDDMQALADEGILNLEDLASRDLNELGKLLAVSDVYEAVTAQRRYQGGLGFEDPAKVLEALEESHPDMGGQIEELMMGLHLRRFAPLGWMTHPDVVVSSEAPSLQSLPLAAQRV